MTEEEITYFVKEPPGIGIVPQKVSAVVVNEQRPSSSHHQSKFIFKLVKIDTYL